MTRALIADDHSILRGGLKELLVRLEDVVCGEAENAQQALPPLLKTTLASS